MEEKSNRSGFTLADYLNVFLLNKKKILLFVLIAGIISAILAFFVIKPVFFSSAIVKSDSKTSGLGGLLSSSGLPGLGDFGDLTEGAGSSQELALYENILISRSSVEEMLIKFNLMEEYNYKYVEDAVKYFREEILFLYKDKAAGTMTIGIFDENPVKAKEMTEYLVYLLNKKNIEMNVQSARNNRQFIEQRYSIVQTDLRNVEDSLKFFQNKYGVAPDIQIQAATKTQIELEAEIKSEEVRLDVLRKILSPDQAEVKAQEEKIVALTKQLRDIQNSDYTEGVLNLKGGPDIAMNFLRLKRDVEIQNKILSTLIPLYEQSKIEENRETPTVLILDPPNIPDKKAKPKRANIVLGAILFTFFVSYMVFFFKMYFKNSFAKS